MRALGIPEQSGAAPLDAACDALGTRRVLLVLDNCEHLIDAIALLAETVLAACPGVQFIATSREALNIASETAWVVPPPPSHGNRIPIPMS